MNDLESPFCVKFCFVAVCLELQHRQSSPKETPLKFGWNRGAVLSTKPTRRYDDITPVLQELHWLPVRRRVEFKIATLVYLSLSGMAPAYLAADCQLVSDEGRRLLRSATSRTCVVRRTYSNYGDRTVFCCCRS